MNRPEVSVPDHEVYVATPGTRVNADEDHDPIFAVEELLRLPGQALESAAVFLGKSHHLLAAAADPGVSPNVVVREREFGIGVAKQRIPVASIEGVEDWRTISTFSRDIAPAVSHLKPLFDAGGGT